CRAVRRLVGPLSTPGPRRRTGPRHQLLPPSRVRPHEGPLLLLQERGDAAGRRRAPEPPARADLIIGLIGPAIIGIAVWCAGGHLAVASAASATTRIAVPAPWWHFVLGFTGAALVPGFRRDPRLALPALLSTIPWWPVSLSAVALIWTGPAAWVPIALSTGAALLSRAPGPRNDAANNDAGN